LIAFERFSILFAIPVSSLTDSLYSFALRYSFDASSNLPARRCSIAFGDFPVIPLNVSEASSACNSVE
jgi:hypothetical protein